MGFSFGDFARSGFSAGPRMGRALVGANGAGTNVSANGYGSNAGGAYSADVMPATGAGRPAAATSGGYGTNLTSMPSFGGFSGGGYSGTGMAGTANPSGLTINSTNFRGNPTYGEGTTGWRKYYNGDPFAIQGGAGKANLAAMNQQWQNEIDSTHRAAVDARNGRIAEQQMQNPNGDVSGSGMTGQQRLARILADPQNTEEGKLAYTNSMIADNERNGNFDQANTLRMGLPYGQQDQNTLNANFQNISQDIANWQAELARTTDPNARAGIQAMIDMKKKYIGDIQAQYASNGWMLPNFTGTGTALSGNFNSGFVPGAGPRS